jgi:hypothetical protein
MYPMPFTPTLTLARRVATQARKRAHKAALRAAAATG